MENIRTDIDTLFSEQQITDAEGFYTAIPQYLFAGDDNIPQARVYAVDEDCLAAFVELQNKIEPIQTQLNEIEKKIKKIQARLQLAQENPEKRLPYELYTAALTKLVELIGSKKQGKTGLKQKLRNELQAPTAERDELLKREGKALWAAWYQIEDKAEFMSEYLNKPTLDFFDPEDVDTQESRYDREIELEDLALAHVAEMKNGVGLVYEDAPRRKMDSSDWVFEKKMEALSNQREQEDAAFAALLRDE